MPHQQGPVHKYYHAFDIAWKLQTRPILDSLHNRLKTMLECPWNTDPSGTYKIYEQLTPNHPLCIKIVNGIA